MGHEETGADRWPAYSRSIRLTTPDCRVRPENTLRDGPKVGSRASARLTGRLHHRPRPIRLDAHSRKYSAQVSSATHGRIAPVHDRMPARTPSTASCCPSRRPRRFDTFAQLRTFLDQRKSMRWREFFRLAQFTSGCTVPASAPCLVIRRSRSVVPSFGRTNLCPAFNDTMRWERRTWVQRIHDLTHVGRARRR